MSSCSSNNYVINTAASYCASSADCTRSSTQTGNTRDHNHHISPYPDIITHNVDVNVGKKSMSPEVSSGISHKETQPQYASVDKKSSKKSKPNPNEQLIGIVKHKDPHQQSHNQHEQQVQQHPEITYQKIHPSSHQYPRHKNEKNLSMGKTNLKVDIIKTTYPDL